MSKFLCIPVVILMLVFMNVMGSKIVKEWSDEKNDIVNYFLEGIDNTMDFAFEFCSKKVKEDTKGNMKSTIGGSKSEEENQKLVKIRDETSKRHQVRFSEYMQELNELSFLQLSTKLNELHKQYISSFQYSSAANKFEKSDPKRYLQFFNEEQLTCLISAMNPDVTTISTLSQDEQAEYLHHWADWLWLFYMNESSDRVWFFSNMKFLKYSDHILDDYESGESSAAFVIYLAHSFIRSINTYRKCAHKIPLTSLISDEYVSQYLFRGIRVEEFDIASSMFPSNFQSYAMNTEGVRSVLHFYCDQHRNNRQNTVVITMMEYGTDMQQLGQPIAIFDLMHAQINKLNKKVEHHRATETEKEVIFPPFCDFSLKEFEINDIKNEFHRELIVAHMWSLAFANPYSCLDTDIKLLWVTEVNCLQLYDPLYLPFVQSKHNELEHIISYIAPRVTMYKNIEFWHSKFPQETHPCIRLFTTLEKDIINLETVEEQEIHNMILEFMEHQFRLSLYKVENKIHKKKVNISNEEYINAFRLFKKGFTTSDVKIFRKKFGIRKIHSTLDAEENKKKYTANTNDLVSSMHQFYTNTKIYIKTQSKETGLSRYQVKLHLFSNTPEGYKWNESLDYCLEWQNNHLISMKNTEQETLEINDCYCNALSDSDWGRFVCEYEDYTYSLNTDFPCTRINKEKNMKEFGRFCKLST